MSVILFIHGVFQYCAYKWLRIILSNSLWTSLEWAMRSFCIWEIQSIIFFCTGITQGWGTCIQCLTIRPWIVESAADASSREIVISSGIEIMGLSPFLMVFLLCDGVFNWLFQFAVVSILFEFEFLQSRYQEGGRSRTGNRYQRPRREEEEPEWFSGEFQHLTGSNFVWHMSLQPSIDLVFYACRRANLAAWCHRTPWLWRWCKRGSSSAQGLITW